MNILQLTEPWAYLAALVTLGGFLLLYYKLVRKRYHQAHQHRRKFIARTWAWWSRSMLGMILWSVLLAVVYSAVSFMYIGRDARMPEALESIFNGVALGALVFWPVVLLTGTFRVIRNITRRQKPDRKV